MALFTALYLLITLVDSYCTDSEYSYNQLDSVVDGTLSGDYRERRLPQSQSSIFFKINSFIQNRTNYSDNRIELNLFYHQCHGNKTLLL